MVFGQAKIDAGSQEIKFCFNSPWELDGVRTLELPFLSKVNYFKFQFPLGIRWCSDPAVLPLPSVL